jgi:hypothetical protein
MPRETGRLPDPFYASGRPVDYERDHLQRAYNGICGVLASLTAAGWQHSIIAEEAESVRSALGEVAFGDPA